MLYPGDEVRFCKGGDGFMGAAAGAEIGELDNQFGGDYLVVFATDFDLCDG